MRTSATAFFCTVFTFGLASCSSGGTKSGTGGQSGSSGGNPGRGGATVAGGSPGGGGSPDTGGRAATQTVAAEGGANSGGGATGAAPGNGGMAKGGATAGSGGFVGDAAAPGGQTGGGGTVAGGFAGSTGTNGADAANGGAPRTGGANGDSGAVGAGGATDASGATSPFTASYLIGADISFSETASSAGQDSLLSQLASHGFNAIRLRTFVDPKASDGYDQTDGTCDLAHTAAFGKKVKALGMFLLVDFHYSDNWADPGKQCVPIAWQGYTSITDLANALYAYTKGAITTLVAAGARPDMVQIGNETTPGMLLHLCDSTGQPTGSAKVTGSTSDWSSLGTLFKAGIKGVKDVDPAILTALHIDRCGDKPTDTAGSALSTSKNYISNATKQGVSFDVFGESCYQKYQGDPNSTTTTKAGWQNTMSGLATAFPNLKLMAAEYGPMQREINDVVFGLAGQQGIGTFNWEPEKGGDWNTGHVLFNWSGNTFTAQPDLSLYDQMKTAYASRL